VKRFVLLLHISLLFLVTRSVAFAQVDPSNSLLLNSNSQNSNSAGTDTGSSNADLDNGRYVIKTPPPVVRVPKADAPVPKPAKTVVVPPTPVASPAPVVPAPVKTVAPPAVVQPSPPPQKASLAEAMQETVLGGTPDDVARYKEKLQSDDPRHNILEVSVAPAYFYTNSSSSYWYRRFFSSGPGVDLNAEMWITPFLGVDLGYFTTLTADMNGDPNTSRTFNVSHRYTDFGFDFRKYFSYSKKSPNLKFYLGYSEYQMIVPASETNRIGLQEYGLDLGLHLTLPVTNYYGWTMGTDVMPFIKINEQSTGVSAQSGSNPSSFAIKFSLGQDFTLDRNNKVFWRVSERIEKSVYSGTASVADPITGVAPSGVSVTEGSTLFEFGYSWGD
jgi:hypothetical protein